LFVKTELVFLSSLFTLIKIRRNLSKNQPFFPEFTFCCLSVFLVAPKPPTAGGPPPPPPPPPPGLFSDVKAEEASEPKGVNALFADINRGDDVTKGQLVSECKLDRFRVKI
jgi:hypothetical protein